MKIYNNIEKYLNNRPRIMQDISIEICNKPRMKKDMPIEIYDDDWYDWFIKDKTFAKGAIREILNSCKLSINTIKEIKMFVTKEIFEKNDNDVYFYLMEAFHNYETFILLETKKYNKIKQILIKVRTDPDNYYNYDKESAELIMVEEI